MRRFRLVEVNEIGIEQPRDWFAEECPVCSALILEGQRSHEEYHRRERMAHIIGPGLLS